GHPRRRQPGGGGRRRDGPAGPRAVAGRAGRGGTVAVARPRRGPPDGAGGAAPRRTVLRHAPDGGWLRRPLRTAPAPGKPAVPPRRLPATVGRPRGALVLRLLHRHFLLPAYEGGIKRRKTFRYWADLERSQWLSRAVLEQIQF